MGFDFRYNDDSHQRRVAVLMQVEINLMVLSMKLATSFNHWCVVMATIAINPLIDSNDN
jgi:hypothetical protein